MGQPRPLFHLFLSFQINVKKCPSSIRRRDSNSHPSDYESPPLTTRPGLPPLLLSLLCTFRVDNKLGADTARRPNDQESPTFKHILTLTKKQIKSSTNYNFEMLSQSINYIISNIKLKSSTKLNLNSIRKSSTSKYLFVALIANTLVRSHHVLADSVGANSAGQAALVDVLTGGSVLGDLQSDWAFAVERSCQEF